MKKQAKLRQITYRPMFTERQMRRLELIRWLYKRGRITEWKR